MNKIINNSLRLTAIAVIWGSISSVLAVGSLGVGGGVDDNFELTFTDTSTEGNGVLEFKDKENSEVVFRIFEDGTKVGATEYCDLDGTSCTTAVAIAALTSGSTLDQAYNSGNTINLDTTEGDLVITVDADQDTQMTLSTSASTTTLPAGGLLVLNNADTDTLLGDGITITSEAGGITDAIDLTDTDIVNALNIGANNLVGTTGNITLDKFTMVGATGNTAIEGTLAVTGVSTFSDDVDMNGNWIGGDNTGGEGIFVATSGNVGIGEGVPTEALHVAGNIYSTGTMTPSDRRLKTKIKTLKGALQKITSLNGVSYDWIDKQKYDNRQHIGVIAQEIEAVYPQAVNTDKSGGKSVNYAVLIAPVIEAIKELKIENENLRQEIEQLKTMQN